MSPQTPPLAPARIAVLSPLAIDQIAAGEVVERPASVVKELVDNAIDAGSTRIDVELEDGGVTRIAVRDNGRGIHPDDLLLAVTRHATSKLRDPSELADIGTLGFRGEALASIAAVARVDLRSRQPSATVGIHMHARPGEPPRLAPAGMPVGTQVEVHGLFANLPARRKFMRAEATEVGQCSETVLRLALVHPEVHFTLRHGKRELLNLPRGTLGERVVQVLGRRAAGPLFAFSGEEDGVAVQVWLPTPEAASRGRGGPYLIVRRRVVRERSLGQIVAQAYGLTGEATACVWVEPPRASVDVNVHPQKSEVRFSDPQRVYAAVRRVLAAATAAAPWAGEMMPAAPLGPAWPAVGGGAGMPAVHGLAGGTGAGRGADAGRSGSAGATGGVSEGTGSAGEARGRGVSEGTGSAGDGRARAERTDLPGRTGEDAARMELPGRTGEDAARTELPGRTGEDAARTGAGAAGAGPARTDEGAPPQPAVHGGGRPQRSARVATWVEDEAPAARRAARLAEAAGERGPTRRAEGLAEGTGSRGEVGSDGAVGDRRGPAPQTRADEEGLAEGTGSPAGSELARGTGGPRAGHEERSHAADDGLAGGTGSTAGSELAGGTGGPRAGYRLTTRALATGYDEHKRGMIAAAAALRPADAPREAVVAAEPRAPEAGLFAAEHLEVAAEEASEQGGLRAPTAARAGTPEFLLCLPGPVAVFAEQGALLAVDLRRLRSHLVYLRLQRDLIGKRMVAIQGLLKPAVVHRAAEEVALIMAAQAELRALGVDVDRFGDDAVLVRGVPAHLRHCVDDADVGDLIARIVPWLRIRTREADASAIERGLLGAIATTHGSDPAPRLARRWLTELLDAGATLAEVPGLRRWTAAALLGGDPRARTGVAAAPRHRDGAPS